MEFLKGVVLTELIKFLPYLLLIATSLGVIGVVSVLIGMHVKLSSTIRSSNKFWIAVLVIEILWFLIPILCIIRNVVLVLLELDNVGEYEQVGLLVFGPLLLVISLAVSVLTLIFGGLYILLSCLSLYSLYLILRYHELSKKWARIFLFVLEIVGVVIILVFFT